MLTELKKQLPQDVIFEFYISKDLSSKNKDYRKNLRECLYQKLIAWKFIDKTNQDQITDLSTPLVQIQTPLKNWYISISHSMDFGGFVVCSNPVGFDIESEPRISRAIVSRISTDEELSLIRKEPQWLWPAKEAAFKALSQKSQFLKTISQLQVVKLISQSTQTKRYQIQARNLQDLCVDADSGIGFITRVNPETFLCIYLLEKNFLMEL